MKTDVHYCKACRKMAGLTQEAAAPLIGIGLRRLQEFESGGVNVPDDVVDRMVTVYNTPMLAWWHLKYRTTLGKHLPDVIMPQSHGDMGMHIVLADDSISTISDNIKRLLSDGKFTQDEYPDLLETVRNMEVVSGRMISAATYAKQEVFPQIKKDRSPERLR